MPISFIDSNTQDKASGYDLTFVIPAAAQADDVMLCFVKQSENTTGREWDDDGGGGNGWIRLAYNRTTGGRDQETAVYYKVHTGTENNPTFTWYEGTDIAAEPMSGALLVYRGVSIQTPIMDLGFIEAQNNAAPPNAGVSISAPNPRVVVVHNATHDDISGPAAPTGYVLRTQIWNGTNDDHRNQFTADATVNTVGPYVPPPWGHSVLNTTPEYQCYTVALAEQQPIGIITAANNFIFGSPVTVDGFGFEALQGSGKVELWSDLTGSIKEVQTVSSWSDTQILFTASQGALSNDALIYIVVTNDSGDESIPFESTVGLTPYSVILQQLGPNHIWPFDGTYDDIVGANPFTTQNVGTNGFAALPISEGTTQSWRVQNGRRVCPNSNAMNVTTTTNRLMGGWIRLGGIGKPLSCIYEEGGGVNNLAFFLGMGNVLVAQLADTGDDNVQAFSNFSLEPDRDYHILFRFSYTDSVKEFALYIDGVKQSVTSGNPLLSTDLDAHSGNITMGGTSGSLEVAGTNVLFANQADTYYSNWLTFNSSIAENDFYPLFARGAIPQHTIVSDTQANMQAALDGLSGGTLGNYPLSIRVEAPFSASDLELTANNVVFNSLASILVEWRSNGTLTWKNTNGSNLDGSKTYSPLGGTVTVENPSTLTLTGLQPNTEVRVYLAGTQTEVAGVENSGTSESFEFFGILSVDVVLLNLQYLYQKIESVDVSNGASLPIQQRFDRNFENP
jgi:hypothetical protein